MLPDSPKVQSIFHDAVEHHAAADWPAFLDQVCGGDVELRRAVEALLRGHEQANSLLDEPAPSAATTAEPEFTAPGTVIGPYKLLEQIGEGGMGTVWMAQQTEPVKRLVAVKLIKAGMDSRQVIARFEAERQALALMDHANIARVLDAGTTDAGRPYFVMDLVKGVPITKYCDEHQFTPRQRLELFLPVCQAVQHAHQKGIIHRDLKPSNVLVALYDGKPVPKVIDFGVAKAAGQLLTDKTLVTGFGNIVGTLEYMSPEQAEVNQLDIDTRSDIYSLGVLLYELLAGSPPFSRKELEKAGMLEMLRVIREQEPSKPSTKLSSSDALPTLSANRGTEPAKLTKLVRGELDWIVMKALEKDRNRRYETANGFAMDVQRYLADEPVQACPPSAGYRLRKFARRNKTGLVMASVISVALLLAVGSLGWAIRDRAARHAKMAGQVELILNEVDVLEREQKWSQALAASRRAEAAVAGGEADAETAERVRQRLKDLVFIERLEQIRMQRATWVEGSFNYAGADRDYSRTFRDYGVDVEELAVEASIDRLKARPALAIPLAAALDDWVDVQRVLSEKDADGWKRLVAVARGIDPDPVRDQLRASWGRPVSEVQDDLRRLAESIDIRAQLPATLHSLASTLRGANQSDAGLRVLRDARYLYPGDFWLNFGLAFELHQRKDYEGASRFYNAAVSIRPHSTAAHNNLGLALRDLNKLDEAVACYRKVIELDRTFANAHVNLGWALARQKKWGEATNAYRKAVALGLGKADVYFHLGNSLAHQKKLDEAVTCYRKAIELDRRLFDAHVNLGVALSYQNKLDEAIAHYKEAIDLDPKHAAPYTKIGSALHEQKKLDAAIAAYGKALELDPKSVEAHLNLGCLLCDDLRAHDKAVECFHKAIELDSNHALARRNLGVAFANQGKLDDAVAAFRKSIELDPQDAQSHYSLGMALSDQKKWHEAVAAYKKAIELAPMFAQAHNNLAWLLATCSDAKLRDPGLAVTLAKKAVELAPQHWAYLNTLGVASYRRGDCKAAIVALEKSMALRKGGDSNDWFFLAMAHWQLGEKDKARAWYDRAVQWMDKIQPKNEELRRFRAEAAELLELKEKK
jgi:tetratricopeptide (TPR) repeat protein/serine/threonine protein kinase